MRVLSTALLLAPLAFGSPAPTQPQDSASTAASSADAPASITSSVASSATSSALGVAAASGSASGVASVTSASPSAADASKPLTPEEKAQREEVLRKIDARAERLNVFANMYTTKDFMETAKAQVLWPTADNYYVCGQWNMFSLDQSLFNYSTTGMMSTPYNLVVIEYAANGDAIFQKPFGEADYSRILNNTALAMEPATYTNECPMAPKSASIVLFNKACYDDNAVLNRSCVLAASAQFSFKKFGTTAQIFFNDSNTPAYTHAPWNGAGGGATAGITMVLAATLASLALM